jgi:hypothetical protein
VAAHQRVVVSARSIVVAQAEQQGAQLRQQLLQVVAVAVAVVAEMLYPMADRAGPERF